MHVYSAPAIALSSSTTICTGSELQMFVLYSGCMLLPFISSWYSSLTVSPVCISIQSTVGIKRALPLSPPVPHQEPPVKKTHRAPLLPTPESVGSTSSSGSTTPYIRQGKCDPIITASVHTSCMFQVVEGHSVTTLGKGTTVHLVNTTHQEHMYQLVNEPPSLIRGLDQVICSLYYTLCTYTNYK